MIFPVMKLKEKQRNSTERLNQLNQLNEMKEEKINMEKIVVLNVEGMMCPHCKKRVEDTISTFENVINVEASLEKNNVTITYQNELNIESVIEKVSAQGYPCKY